MKRLAKSLSIARFAVLAAMMLTVSSYVSASGASDSGSTQVAANPCAGKWPAIGPLPKEKAEKASLVEMGKRLFFDARISGDGAISCGSCHDPKKGFADGIPLSKMYPGTDGFRNTPSLINVRYKKNFPNAGWGWDGRIGANLNDAVRDQLTESYFMNIDMRIMHERMKGDPVYVKMCADNFGGDCSSGKGRKAIVAFMNTLVSKDTPFDAGKMSAAAKNGQKVFEGKGRCIQCHNGPYLTNGEPYNTGVPEALEIFKDPIRHLTYRSVVGNHGVPNDMAWRRDVGYYTTSKNYADVGKFVTPTLRELKYTAPYMHNGTIKTLAEVVDFYNAGGGKDDVMPNALKPLGLSHGEKKDLVAFLESLSSAKPVTVEVPKISQKYPPIKDWLKVKN